VAAGRALAGRGGAGAGREGGAGGGRVGGRVSHLPARLVLARPDAPQRPMLGPRPSHPPPGAV